MRDEIQKQVFTLLDVIGEVHELYSKGTVKPASSKLLKSLDYLEKAEQLLKEASFMYPVENNKQ